MTHDEIYEMAGRYAHTNDIPTKPVKASDMPRFWWIRYEWENVRDYQDKEPVYLCTGLRDIAKAKEAAEQIDYFLHGSTDRGPSSADIARAVFEGASKFS